MENILNPKSAESDTPANEESTLAPPKYEIRPALQDRFQSLNVKEIINQTMQDILSECTYESSQAEKWVKDVSNTTLDRVNALDMKRYKLIVQVILGEVRGAGIKSGMRCIWDSECDNFTSDMFQNDSLFCHTTVYGVYFY
ncbi:dynein light chain Tctex-type protein 2B-like isoform X2 [Arctopsyche grandis]|uniref:dynein light chain Tctex-type protein 2B-like isoform X2 n=1 Tax=Arctopsyche grandis TaxID=121162 RepID=UPI00406D7EA0